MYHYTDGGLKNVWLVNGYKICETAYGKGLVIHNLEGLNTAICLSLTFAKKSSSLTGIEFRYLRSTGFKQSTAGLAKLIGHHEQEIVKWEQTGKVPKWADKLIRLIYLAQAEGSVPIASEIN